MPPSSPDDAAKANLAFMLYTPTFPIASAILDVNGLWLTSNIDFVIFLATFIPIIYIIDKRYCDDKKIYLIKKKPLGKRILAMVFTIIALAVTFLSWILNWFEPVHKYLVHLFEMYYR